MIGFYFRGSLFPISGLRVKPPRPAWIGGGLMMLALCVILVGMIFKWVGLMTPTAEKIVTLAVAGLFFVAVIILTLTVNKVQREARKRRGIF